MRFAVIGLGYWGRNYLRLIGERSEAEVVAVADVSAEALGRAARELPGVRATTDPFEALSAEEVDAVVIATPAPTHFALAVAALETGKQVLCEKPLAMTVSDCERLMSAAEETGNLLFVGHTFIYNPAIQVARKLMSERALGVIRHCHATWTAPGPIRLDVNAVWDLAPHPISILVHLLGCQPTAIAATGQAILHAEREDVAFVHLRFGDAATADVHLSWLAPRKVRALTITGDRRVVVFDDLAGQDKLRIFDTPSLEDDGYVPVGSSDFRRPFERPSYVPSMSSLEPLAAQLDHFVECCRIGIKPQSGGLSGHEVVRILELAQLSLRCGGEFVPVQDEVMSS